MGGISGPRKGVGGASLHPEQFLFLLSLRKKGEQQFLTKTRSGALRLHWFSSSYSVSSPFIQSLQPPIWVRFLFLSGTGRDTQRDHRTIFPVMIREILTEMFPPHTMTYVLEPHDPPPLRSAGGTREQTCNSWPLSWWQEKFRCGAEP